MSKRHHQPIDIEDLFANQRFVGFKQSIEQRKKTQEHTLKLLQKFHLGTCQLSKIEQNRAIIATPSATWLNRLRQLKFQLLSELRQTYPGLITLEFKINPQLASIKPEPAKKIINQRKITVQSAEHIREIARDMPDELKEKMEKIAALCGEKNK
ncbi:MAG: hypothetical protein CENE_00642 [Candidatus Celerinatantimonas neptuna]|nr:MAG: hypothetical protein CENE_00642 [Candidatus Celerinatantimonas neptuna]